LEQGATNISLRYNTSDEKIGAPLQLHIVYYVASCYKSVADSEDLATDSGALITSM
jgi:hypothetical protein